MAEIQTETGNNRKKGFLRRRKKLSTRIDLTPMVDLGFLLITFFIVTTTWSKAKSMNFLLPADSKIEMPVAETTSLTIIPISNDKLFYYHGRFDQALVNSTYGVTGYAMENGIGDIIRKKQASLNRMKKFTAADLMLIIKPGSESNYKNLVDAMDEVLINNVTHYVITDLDKVEKEVMQQLKIN